VSSEIRLTDVRFGEREGEAVLAVLRSGRVVQGPRVEHLERSVADRVGVAHAVAVSSGTAALHVALVAHGVGPSDEVITPPLSFIASANAALHAGARPVFADVRADTFTIDPAEAERCLGNRTRAIVPVHLWGQAADMDELVRLGEAHGIPVIEDAAQAFSSCYRGRPAGGLGHAGCFSFYATKELGVGEGGMITTDDERVADAARLLRSHGQAARYHHVTLGYNYRLTELAAAIGLEKLRDLDERSELRRRNGEFLRTACERAEGLVPQAVLPDRTHAYHQFAVRVLGGPSRRDAFGAHLRTRDVETRQGYLMAIHQQPAYRELGYRDERCPTAETLAAEVMLLPVHAGLTEAELERIAAAIEEFGA
jgi:dTDP-4-amino-4,6-dideoxygalactose transaminase